MPSGAAVPLPHHAASLPCWLRVRSCAGRYADRAGGCGCGGAGGWAGLGDGAVDGHRCRGWVVPPRLRPRYLADRRTGPGRGKRACSSLTVRRCMA